MADINNMIMDWGDTIESDGQQFVLLPEGDYTFTVANFERGSFNGSDKIPACPMAKLTLRVDAGQHGQVDVPANLFLYKPQEWKLAAFFRSIGHKKHGEKLVMDWQRTIGAHGRCHIKPRSFTGRDGQVRETNEITNYIDYDPKLLGFVQVQPTDLPWESGVGSGF